jgi:hypothetical protein
MFSVFLRKSRSLRDNCTQTSQTYAEFNTKHAITL